jgi:Endoribonuclease L-PSP
MRSLYRRGASTGKEREFGMCRTDGARQHTALLPGLRRSRLPRRAVRKHHHEQACHSRRATVQLCRGAQGSDRDGRARRRSRLCIEHPALRSGDGRDQAHADRAAGRDRARADEALPDGGGALERVIKCNVYCTDAAHFQTINAVYARYFPSDPPARSFICVGAWHGPFDVEMDCVAAV